jgi:hypothetical protein
MQSESPSSWIERKEIDHALSILTKEALVTISWLVWHIRKITKNLLKDKEYIEFLYQRVYLPNKELFDSLIEDYEINPQDGFTTLMELVGGITSAFVYRVYGYENERTSLRYDTDYHAIKRYNNENIQCWIELWWLEKEPLPKPPWTEVHIFEKLRHKIQSLLRLSTRIPQEDIGGYRVTPIWKSITAQYTEMNRF